MFGKTARIMEVRGVEESILNCVRAPPLVKCSPISNRAKDAVREWGSQERKHDFGWKLPHSETSQLGDSFLGRISITKARGDRCAYFCSYWSRQATQIQIRN